MRIQRGLHLLAFFSPSRTLKNCALVSASAVFVCFSGCGVVDAPERFLDVLPFKGRVVDTTLTDAQLAEKGTKVVYRFRSVPGLVYLRRTDETMGLGNITESTRIRELVAKASKTWRQGSPRSVVSSNAPPVPTYLEAGFDLVPAMLDRQKAGLEPVRVAIIDSGVVASTRAIGDALVEVTNYTQSPIPEEWQNHATAIASLYSGLEWKGQILNSYAPNVRLHSIKISFAGDRQDELSETFGALQLAVALDEAVARGARIVNMSFSYRGTLPEQVRVTEKAVIAAAAAKGVVFIAAAGNAGESLDGNPLFPARYDLENILVVGNHSSMLRRAYSSNYGTSVDVTAQGVNLPLSNKEGSFDYFSGTSFAVPVVGAALATYFGVFPGATLRDALFDLAASSQNSYAGEGLEAHAMPLANRIVSRFGRLRADSFLALALNRPAFMLSPPPELEGRRPQAMWQMP
ncbi:MAG: S8 family serine peptidase [Silvanigrellales bacterium]|nr:S8 family serine peptidase [Silvanigrellales bacterium]